MKLTWLDMTIFALYFGIIAVIGWWASRRAGGSKRDYFLAGDKLPWWMVGGSIVAANISLDCNKLFIVMEARSVDEAEVLVKQVS